MPELPEVETVRRTLENRLIGEKIINVDVYCRRIVQNDDLDYFKNSLINETIREIRRYGKYLIFILDHVSILSHLRMEGKYYLKNINDELVKHEHIVFSCLSGLSIRYHDVRKFGTMRVLNTTSYEEILLCDEIKKMGKEANDEGFSGEELHFLLRNKLDPIKSALLDQSIISGLGNIYVDEVLFMSGIHPLYPSKKVDVKMCDEILYNSRIILSNAIKAGGTTIRSYTSSLGVTGLFQLNLNVHTKVGEPCPKCGNIIKKIKVGGRGTYFCDKCQKLPKRVIGITGGISSGKSVVSGYLRNLGYVVIDSDEISRELTKNNIECLMKIKDVFGDEYFNDGVLDRKKLGSLVFSSKKESKKLTDIIHPLVRKELERRISEEKGELIFIDVPLLFESKMNDLCDKIICVDIEKELNIDRLMKRDNIDYEYAVEKINSQMDLKKKCEKSHFIIDNSFDLCYTYKQVDEILLKL